jgi:hypothetical protein
LDRISLSNKPKLIITQKLQKQIDWLHKTCGSTEWSGELITREIGKITDLDNWTIIAEDIFLVDVGSPGFTGYNVNEGAFKAADITELYDKFDGLIDGDLKTQHVHSHHNMGTFFSGTDWSQLHDRALESNYFMMLITNFKNEHIAKVAFKAKSKTTTSGLSFANDVENEFGELEFENEDSKEVLVVMDCIVEVEPCQTELDITDLKQVFETLALTPSCDKQELQDVVKLLNAKISTIDVDQYFLDRYEHVKKESKPAFTSGYGTTPIGFKKPVQDSYVGKTYQPDLWGRFEEPLNKSQKREKGLMEMSDKEWEDFINDDPQNGEVLMGQREGFILLNKFIDKGEVIKNATSPIDSLLALNSKLKTATEVYNWCNALEYNFRDMFDATYPNGDDADFENILEELIQYFSEYQYNRLIKELSMSLAQMHEFSTLN